MSSDPPAPDLSDLWRNDATAIASLVASKQVSALEVLEAHLTRIEEVNPKLNAVVRVLDTAARDVAMRVDRRTYAGEMVGPLGGVPLSVKENIDVLGSPTTQGVVVFADAMPTKDAPIVERVRAAGAVIFARTNLPDFGLRVHTDSGLHGLTRNPWVAHRTVAGSSGGEASAISSGMSPIGLGNDVGGSLRSPANACGIFSIKPSFGRIPQASSLAPETFGPGMASMCVQGVLARSVRDLRLGLVTLMGAHPRDPLSWSVPLEGSPVSKRVLMVPEVGGGETDPRIASAVRQAGQSLAEAGYEVEEGQLPRMDEMLNLWFGFLTVDFEDLRELMDAVISEGGRQFMAVRDVLPAIPATRLEMVEANIARLTIARLYSEMLFQTPLVLLPTWAQVPFDNGWDTSHASATLEMIRPVIPANYLGLPAVCVPVGMVDGSPVAVQLMGDRFREDVCLDAASVLEASGTGPVTPIDPKW